MTDITLVNPKLKTWSPNVYPPLGLSYVAASLEQAGHKVRIIDMNSHRVSDRTLQKAVRKSGMVGITGLITEYHEVLRLAAVVREANRDALVVVGGPLATTHPGDVLVNSEADVVVIGDGEQTAVELASVVENKRTLESVKGIGLKKGGKTLFSELRGSGGHLDKIPYPARHLLDMDRYTTHHFKTFGIKVPKIKSTTLISSRGCPYACTYCHKNVGGWKWRGRSPENIIGEMWELYHKYGMRGFVFNDDTFVLNKKRALDFCYRLIESGMDVSWYCNGRINLMSDELLQAMRRSGCVGVAYGIESGNQEMLDRIKKGITLKQIRDVVQLTRKHGIHVTGYFMLGMLGDTRETIQETLDFAEELDLDFYGFGITSPIPGTEMYAQAVERGLVEEGKRLEDWSFHAQMNLTEDVSTGELEQLNEYAFRKFTIEKRWGKRYLLNPRLWWEGLRTLVFLARKRNVSELIKKVLVLIKQ